MYGYCNHSLDSKSCYFSQQAPAKIRHGYIRVSVGGRKKKYGNPVSQSNPLNFSCYCFIYGLHDIAWASSVITSWLREWGYSRLAHTQVLKTAAGDSHFYWAPASKTQQKIHETANGLGGKGSTGDVVCAVLFRVRWNTIQADHCSAVIQLWAVTMGYMM